MKLYSPAAIAALEDGTAIVSGAVDIACSPVIRVWGGHGVLTLNGNAYQPLGDRALALVGGASLGGSAQNLTLTLSGIEPDVLELLDADEVRGAGVAFWTLIFDGSGTQLLDAKVHQRGRLDRLPVNETSGGEATISALVESPGRGLGRRTGRMRTDADQRLIKATDGGMRLVSYAGEKQLYWGGKRPVTASGVVNGGAVTGTGSLARDVGKIVNRL
ncbi:hypothetical protein FSZ31_04410 [Sphingorhabdus soli]|uniref:Uncharacterized protein n=1 Tax=Flavisphingopyxis soli TaxID=2601267 RepID=A0A5C6UN40_9SPHN|nr:hypothetical protein [Sphingorhabdus soli]TXC73970.1 hypothetical protein FSZ31_04410 [Sphingorhabdus soli]